MVKILLDWAIAPACIALAIYNICDQIHMPMGQSLTTAFLVFVGVCLIAK